MAIREPANIALSDEFRHLATMLDSATHKEKGILIESTMTKFGWSRAKVYTELKKVGWVSERKTRSDRGSTKQDMQALQQISATLKLGVRKNGKATMQTPTSVSMLSQNGVDIAVGNSRINSLMRERQMHLAAQRQAKPYQSMQSKHPNHVHQVDPSLCLLYYMPDGSQRMIQDDELYKNKLDKLAKIKLKVWRYVLTDHYSASIVVRYYEAQGENQANLYDFLLYAWQKKDGIVIHGVPKILLWDKGSANSAGAIKNALRALDVENITHKAGNARAKGSVENGNNLTETLFESRLQYEPVQNVDELNAAVEAWYNAYNANAIPRYDSRLKRKLMAEPQIRYSLWQMIRKDQLRILLDMDVCRALLAGNVQERQVGADLTVSIHHPGTKQREFYDVSHIPGIHVKQMISIEPMVYGHAQIIVSFENYKGEITSQMVQPIAANPQTGFRDDAPFYGEEFASKPDTIIETQAKANDRLVYGANLNQDEIEKAKKRGDTPFGGLDAHSHLKEASGPAFMTRPGQLLNVPDRLQIEIKPLTLIQMKMQLRDMLGRPVTPIESDLLKKWYPEGVTEDRLPEVMQALLDHAQAPLLAAM